MTKPSALVVYGDGINCDMETMYAIELAGFHGLRVHTSDLLSSPHILLECQLLVLPGGFSFGDEIESGKILALKLKDRVSDLLHQFIDKDNFLIGICNGFQVLVQLGILPNSDKNAARTVSLTKNSGGRFINRWVELNVNHETPCRLFDSLDIIELPIRHGEGRLLPSVDLDPANLELIKKHAVLRYASDINGSFDNIAALTNAKGNVLGLMPHPEAYLRFNQHPNWNRPSNWLAAPKANKSMSKAAQVKIPQKTTAEKPYGLVFFQNAFKQLTSNTPPII